MAAVTEYVGPLPYLTTPHSASSFMVCVECGCMVRSVGDHDEWHRKRDPVASNPFNLPDEILDEARALMGTVDKVLAMSDEELLADMEKGEPGEVQDRHRPDR